MLPVPATGTMTFAHQRTIHFADTDAAGVVFFANIPAICHEAYEEALAAAGINLSAFFRDNGVVIPISKCEAEYLRPLQCGDKVRVSVRPKPLTENSFEIQFEVTRLGPPPKSAALVKTAHVCIDSKTRRRVALPATLADWVRSA
jgi:1,4-dihydroxy-2-naphthoyl-CoA hydrolase